MCYMHYKRFTDGKPMDAPRRGQHHDGRESHPYYKIYKSMKGRCYTERHTSYAHYGGKGIKVCDKWLKGKNGFWNFVKDMGGKPKGHTIDRIDSDGDYTPDNCRWANSYLQGQNKRKCANRLGYYGIRMHKEKFQPYYNHKGRMLSLGTYDTLDEAIAVRRRLESSVDAYKEADKIRSEFKIINRKRRGGWQTTNGKWKTSISVNGKRHNMGTFDTQEEAIKERDLWITKNLQNA